ncbi:MAG: transcription antitermination factor NusB [Dehalococcoidia bacterium]|nr:transcription antitermination factor NusB [Dehalococcoidia bacterium]
MAGIRRQARIIALQVLYETDCTGHAIQGILANLAGRQDIPLESADFIKELVRGVVKNKPELDDIIKRFAPAFPLEQISIVDRNILRLAIFEALFNSNTPIRVIINEAIELAKGFGGDSSYRLINGVLGSIAQEYKPISNKT